MHCIELRIVEGSFDTFEQLREEDFTPYQALSDICIGCLEPIILERCPCGFDPDVTFRSNNGYIRSKKILLGQQSQYKRAEHLIIAEKALGHELPDGAIVHHHNRIRRDNRNQNLVICQDASYHSLIHARMRILEMGGDPDIDGYCGRCKKCKPRSQFAKSKRTWNGCDQMCSGCQSLRMQKYYEKKRNLQC